MWWKVYFWINLILTIIGLVSTFGLLSSQSLKLGDWLILLLSIVTLIALYSYAFNKQTFSSNLWKTYFWVAVILILISIISPYTPLKDVLSSFLSNNFYEPKYAISQIFGIIVQLPAYYVVYQLGYKHS